MPRMLFTTRVAVGFALDVSATISSGRPSLATASSTGSISRMLRSSCRPAAAAAYPARQPWCPACSRRRGQVAAIELHALDDGQFVSPVVRPSMVDHAFLARLFWRLRDDLADGPVGVGGDGALPGRWPWCRRGLSQLFSWARWATGGLSMPRFSPSVWFAAIWPSGRRRWPGQGRCRGGMCHR